MPPRIGINCDVEPGARRQGDGRLLKLNPDFVRGVRAAGGLPLLLPPLAAGSIVDGDGIDALLDGIDGLILSGGADYHPRAFGQDVHARTVLLDPERDASDHALVQAALRRGLPLLAVCGGMQLLNVTLGGSLHQHLGDFAPAGSGLLPAHGGNGDHGGTHEVRVERASRLAAALDVPVLMTNSRHHQAVDRLGRGLAVTARAADGVVEGIESAAGAFVVGVQWHPEEHDEEPHRRLFHVLVCAAADRTAGAAGRSAEGR